MPELVASLIAVVGVAALHGLGRSPLPARAWLAALAWGATWAGFGGSARPTEAAAAAAVAWSAAACAVALAAPVWPRVTRIAIASSALAAVVLGGVLAF
ncbi:MAG: hypothetical protein IPK07_12025 [Deltaproteobacteria bacterium]|nr:hypothetical protein [Deltaproteobacteria bacterium]